MPSTYIIVILIIATVVLSAFAFALYSTYSSSISNSSYNISYAISVAKAIQITISPIAFSALILKGQPLTFNVSYLVNIYIPDYRGYLTLVPFVANPDAGSLYYYIPKSNQNASILGYSPQNLNVQVFAPQGDLIGKVQVNSYQVINGLTFQVSAKVNQNQLVVLWVLVNINGNYYRIAYPYVNPSSLGLGLYVITSTGYYNGNNSLINVKPPLFFDSNKGFAFGLWFSPKVISGVQNNIFNITFGLTGQRGKFYVTLLQAGSSLILSLSGSKYIIYNSLTNSKYFFVFEFGSQLVDEAHYLQYYIYDKRGNILNSSKLPFQSGTNGYNFNVTFGSTLNNIYIYQAFFVSNKDNNSGVTYVNNAINSLVSNGYLYNNTGNLYSIIKSTSDLYAMGYWYFVLPKAKFPLPTTINAYLWYYPNGGQSLVNATIPETGQNTWSIGN